MGIRYAAMFLFLVSALFAFECNVREYSTGEKIEGTQLYEAKDKVFTAQIPNGWSKLESRFDYAGKDDNVTGIKLQGPQNKLGANAKISVIYYEYGGFFSDYKEYIELVQNSPTRENIPKKERYKHIKVGAKKAISFEIKTFELIFEQSINKLPDTGADYKFVPPYKKVSMLEEYIVVPAKRGFFVLCYEAPVDIRKECTPLFGKVIKSIHFESNIPWTK